MHYWTLNDLIRRFCRLSNVVGRNSVDNQQVSSVAGYIRSYYLYAVPSAVVHGHPFVGRDDLSRSTARVENVPRPTVCQFNGDEVGSSSRRFHGGVGRTAEQQHPVGLQSSYLRHASFITIYELRRFETQNQNLHSHRL
jgi:hypothetical protein